MKKMEDMLVRCVFILIVTVIMLFSFYVLFYFFSSSSKWDLADLIIDFLEKHFGDKTNGDMIRSMDDEELAEFFTSGDIVPCNHCKERVCNECDVCEREYAQSQFVEWLAADQEEGLYD